MKTATRFTVDRGWQILFRDLGVDSNEVLKRAQLPGDLLNQKAPSVSAGEYFRLWNGVADTINDPAFALKLAGSISTEAFHPAFFAALCSPNLTVAMKRISQFKRLVGPLVYNISEKSGSITITVDCMNVENPLPDSLTAFELAFIVHFSRMGTRERLQPLEVISSVSYLEDDAYAEYFGITPISGKQNSVTFSAKDAVQPFVTENAGMWKFFEPELQRRLSEIEAEERFAIRVRAALLELLPAGQSSMEAVAAKLLISKRTLQRRLTDEATTFKHELNHTREKLARHYLTQSELSGAEISFLLGFEDPNSFFRAFHTWTGQTPKQLRIQHAQHTAH